MKKKILMFLLSAVLTVQVCTPANASGTDTPELPDASSASEETPIEYENPEDTSEAETTEAASDSSSEDKMTNEAPSSDSDPSDSEEEDHGSDSSASNVVEDENQDDRAGYYEPDEKYPGVYTDKDPEFTVENDTTLKYDEENKCYQLYYNVNGEPYYGFTGTYTDLFGDSYYLVNGRTIPEDASDDSRPFDPRSAYLQYNEYAQCRMLLDYSSDELCSDYTGWFWDQYDDGKAYYIKNGWAVTGLQWIDNKCYFFDRNKGLPESPCVVPIVGGQSVYDDIPYYDTEGCLDYDLSDCKLYYIGSNGVWSENRNGWYTAYDENGDGEKVYLVNGIAQQGFKTINGKHYFFGDVLVSENLFEERGEVCGALYHNFWFYFEDCFLYYSMADGRLAEGFKTIDDVPYYFWPKTENGHYSRTMATGWFKVNGFTYYAIPYVRGKGYDNIFDYPDSGMLVSGFKTIGGKGYYFWPKTENGHYSRTMAKGWFTVNGFKYYAGSDGVLTTGFKTISGKKYYFWPKTSGGHYSKTMAKGWFTLNGFKYYADKNGVLAAGWKTINGKKYYFWPKTSGGHYANTMAKGRVKIDGRWYYFQSNGVKR